MSKFNEDRNIIGRIGAVAIIVAVAFGLHRLGCGTGEMCPVMKTDSCCSGSEATPKTAAPTAGAVAPKPHH